MSAAAKSVPAARPARSALDEQVRKFALNWLDLELDDAQCAELALRLSAPARARTGAAQPGGGLRGQAGDAIDTGRQRIQNVIQQGLGRAQVALLGNAKAERAAETAVLGELERAESLDALRTPKPAPGGANTSEVPLIGQIAASLTGLIERKVDDCFQEQFGPLAQQLQAVIDAAKASGLLPNDDASAASQNAQDEAKNSGKTADKSNPERPGDKPAQARGPASQRS